MAIGFGLVVACLGLRAAEPVIPPSHTAHDTSAGLSFAPLLSADGRYVVFTSEASDLVEDDANGARDVFLRDRQLGTTMVISRELNQTTPGHGDSFAPDMTPDARVIVFQSAATNLVPAGTMPLSSNDLRTLIYRYDVPAEEMRLININRPADAGWSSLTNFEYDLVAPRISPDGIRVLFEVGRNQHPINLDWYPPETFQPRNDTVFLWNSADGTTELVSMSRYPSSQDPDIIREYWLRHAQYENRSTMSSDGRFVAVSRTTDRIYLDDAYAQLSKMNVVVWDRSGITNIVPILSHDVAGGDNEYTLVQDLNAGGEWLLYSKGPFLFGGNSNPDTNTQLWLHNLLTGDFRCVSSNRVTGEIGNGISDVGAMSQDGDWIAFFSTSSNLVDGDVDTATDVFLQSRETGETERISPHPSWSGDMAERPELPPVLTPDGRYILYQAIGSGLFRHDRIAGTNAVITTDVSTDAPDISDDGRFVSFTALPSSINPADPNPYRNAYVYDCETGLTELISVRDPSVQLSTPLSGTSLEVEGASFNGRFITFTGTLLGTDDRANGNPLVWVRDTQLGTNILVSVDRNGDTLTNGDLFRDLQISADGRWICFTSTSTNLSVLNDANRFSDVFLRDLENGVTRLVSKNLASDGSTSEGAHSPILSRDGSIIVFNYRGPVGTPSGSHHDLFGYEVATGEVRLLTTAVGSSGGLSGYAEGQQLSEDGRILVFRAQNVSFLPSLPPLSANSNPYLLDLLTGDREWLGGDSNEGALFAQGYHGRFVPGVDGSRVLLSPFPNAQTNLFVYDRALGYSVMVATNVHNVAGDADSAVALQRFEGSVQQQPQVYRMDPSFAFEELMSVATDGETPGSGFSHPVDVSPDGRYVVYRTHSSNLSLLDDRDGFDLYLYDSVLRVNILLSRSSVTGRAAMGNSGKAVFTRDGTRIIFESFASDVVANDSNSDRDIFVAQISMPDSDGDTLPDDWEMAFFGNLDQDATTDTDMDGLKESDELAAGTSPINSSSVLRAITVMSITGGSATVLWSSVVGKRYQVQYRSGFEGQGWIDLGSSVVATGSTSQLLDSEPGGGGRRFYRVVLLD